MAEQGTTLLNIVIPYPTEGVIRTAQLNDTIAPENSVQMATNCNFDRVGATMTRPGVDTYATQRGGSITSLGTLTISGGTHLLYSQVGTNISSWNGTAWTTRRTTTVTTKARFDQYLGYIFMCNGASGDAIESSNGGAFGTTLLPTSPLVFPKCDYINAGYENRLWGAVKGTNTLYFTDKVVFTPPSTFATLGFPETTTGSGIPANLQLFAPSDGESITGLKKTPRALLVFRENTIYRVYGAYSIDPYPAYNVGTYSQESIVTTKSGLFFHHSSGIYKFDYSNQPTEISRRIIDFIRAIPKTYYDKVTAIYDGFDIIKWYVGPVTVEGVIYSNCVLRYTISTEVWTVYDYKGNDLTCAVLYDDGTDINQIAGFASGKVGKLDYGTTDFGSGIYYEIIDRWRSFTEMYAKTKSISGMNVYSENGAGTRVEYQIEKSPPNTWTYIDTINTQYDALFPNASTDDFFNIRLRMSGNNSGTPIIFHGVEILSIQDKGFSDN